MMYTVTETYLPSGLLSTSHLCSFSRYSYLSVSSGLLTRISAETVTYGAQMKENQSEAIFSIHGYVFFEHIPSNKKGELHKPI